MHIKVNTRKIKTDTEICIQNCFLDNQNRLRKVQNLVRLMLKSWFKSSNTANTFQWFKDFSKLNSKFDSIPKSLCTKSRAQYPYNLKTPAEYKIPKISKSLWSKSLLGTKSLRTQYPYNLKISAGYKIPKISKSLRSKSLLGTKFLRTKCLLYTKSLHAKSFWIQNPFLNNPFQVQNPFLVQIKVHII